MRQLVLFDFDGTLTKKDSLTEFFKFCYANDFNKFYYKKPFIFLVLFKLKLIGYQKIKAIRIKHLVKRFPKETLEQKAQLFREHHLPKLLKKSALKKINEFQNSENTDMYIVSASLDIILCDWAKVMGMGLITNELEIKNNSFTGRFVHQNDCNFNEKVNRIKALINIDEYDHVSAYGDTEGDQPMLSIANESHFCVFKD